MVLCVMHTVLEKNNTKITLSKSFSISFMFCMYVAILNDEKLMRGLDIDFSLKNSYIQGKLMIRCMPFHWWVQFINGYTHMHKYCKLCSINA